MKLGRQIFPVMFGLSVAMLFPCAPTMHAAEETNNPVQASDGQEPSHAEDVAAQLEERRKAAEAELKALSETINLSDTKIEGLRSEIEALESRAADIREALVESAEKRNVLETQIETGEQKLVGLREKEAEIRASLHERRGLLAEVLAALERMGRNPPPAILVKPADALGSVRSAILLGAVVPGLRKETATLLSDLETLSNTLASITMERESLKTLMLARLEEEKRMSLLLEENRQQSEVSAQVLADEQKRAEELAARAGSMQELMASLEQEIGSVREAAKRSRELEAQRKQTEGGSSFDPARLPDKNRIAPAFAFASLKGKLSLPVRGEVISEFGDPRGGGSKAQGVTIAARADALVTAPADGWVIYAGKFRSFGQTIVLDVGENYRIVMTGMEKVNVRAGQFVVAGEPVAEMGATRIASAAALALETEAPTLYIEFWHYKDPIDSRAWWSAEKTGKASNDT